MNGTHEFLITVGCLLLVGLATDALGKYTSLPRVSLLIVFGALIGPGVLNLIPAFFLAQFQLIAQLALVMVGFLLGSKLNRDALAANGRAILSVSLLGALVTGCIVFAALLVIGVELDVAVILACIATATDGIATVDVVLELKQETPFARLLLAVVALDDGWGLIIFSIGLAFATGMTASPDASSPVMFVMHDLGGAILLGLIIGLPAAYLTGRIKPGMPMRSEALGLVFLCGGLAIWLEVSFLVATMIMGAMISNFARHHKYPFDEIEGLEWPVLSIFFVLAGASLEFTHLGSVGLVGGVYILSRFIGKLAGGLAGARAGGCDALTRRWIGLAMLPHAGAALGMALVAADYFPEYGNTLLTVVISATILYEIVGPIAARFALLRVAAGHAGKDQSGAG